LSYAEKQQRRIAKKFGTQGSTLGEDQNSRAILEEGKKIRSKPRVASSARGRELRAAAALQRFENQTANNQLKEVDDAPDGSESESDYDEPEIGEEAIDRDGKKIVDSKGRGMVQVCKSEEDIGESEDMRREMRELQEVDQSRDEPVLINAGGSANPIVQSTGQGSIVIASESDEEDVSLKRDSKLKAPLKNRVLSSGPGSKPAEKGAPQKALPDTAFGSSKKSKRLSQITSTANAGSRLYPSELSGSPVRMTDCQVCSMSNDLSSLTCIACMNVLRPDKFEDHWRCQSLACQGGKYINAGDCGVCGVCGVRRGVLSS
jgi:hypothetical protein